MHFTHIIGPDSLRAKATTGIVEQNSKNGYQSVVYIAPDNKSTIILNDYIGTGNVPINYYEVMTYSNVTNTRFLTLPAYGQEQEIENINAIMNGKQNHLDMSCEEKRALFNSLDYLISTLMFRDLMPSVDIALLRMPEDHGAAYIWTIAPFQTSNNPIFAATLKFALAQFLRLNRVSFLICERENFLIINDIFQFARAAIRIHPAPAITPHFKNQNLRPWENKLPPCPITGRTIQNPTIGPDGHTYEDEAIRAHINSGNNISPVSGLPMQNLPLLRNEVLRPKKLDINDLVFPRGAPGTSKLNLRLL